MKAIETDVLIIGAGPAGTVAGAWLKRAGFSPVIVEKQTFPRFVIGESLLPHTMDLLKEAGLLEVVQSQNYMKKHGAVFLRGTESCNFDFGDASFGGWDHTFQVPRADFDKTLADEVEARGVPILYRHAVSAVDFSADTVTATVDSGDGSQATVRAKFVLDCSGYGRVLPRLLKLDSPSSQALREAWFTHVLGDIRPTAREEGKIWICMHPGGAWIWIIPFQDGRTSVGVVAKPEFYNQFSGDDEARFRAMVMSDPNAVKRLGNVRLLFSPQKIGGFSCAVTTLHGPRFALTGNASEFLDPVFSSGVTLAMASALQAARLAARELRGEAVDWPKEYAQHVMKGVATFRAYVNAWYDEKFPSILFAPQRRTDIMRQICSVLAGYVWDESNPFVTQAERALTSLAHITRSQIARAASSVA